MLLSIILNDLKKGAEELCAGIASYTLVGMSAGIWVTDKILSLLIPLTIAYMVHKLKKNYWELDRPFFKNIIKDIRTWLKEKK